MTERRWAWAEIDLGAVRQNVLALKAFIRPETRFMAVVKADGYGHGAVPVARTALAAGAERLGVATVDEAAALRAAGITAPVQLMSEPPESAIEAVLGLDAIPAVTTREFAGALSRAATARGVTARFHLKVDTGMNRIGVRAEEAASFAAMLSELPNVALEGTFTHFANADVPGDWDHDKQKKRFREALAAMRSERVDPGIVHAANSAATILDPDSHFDMVRCGIALYGLHPAQSTHGHIALEPAMAVKARATLVKRIGLGEGVSYGLTWHAGASAMIATLPLGYADGVPRILSNRMRVLHRGRLIEQVGRVCMDQLMVDATLTEPRRGELFTVVGEDGVERITLDDLAEATDTITYELACGFGMRLERVYADA